MYLEHLYDGPNIDVTLLSRFLSFFAVASASENPYVKFCTKLCNLSNTAVAFNKRRLLSILNDDGQIFKLKTVVELKRMLSLNMSRCNVKCVADANCVKELCLLKEKYLECELNVDEITCLLNELCVN